MGKDRVRKGGQFTFEVVKYLNNLGINTILKVIGTRKKRCPDSPFIKNLGYIDKNKNFNKFIKEISSWHFLLLFSYNKLIRSILESLKLEFQYYRIMLEG